MIYAPVVIPTLSRFEHLRQCLDSLNGNHNADKTEVFVSVDYPPSEKYREGHDKICDYLDHREFRFKKLHVFKQQKNLGIGDGVKYGNGVFLLGIVLQRFDRWIFTEDDNVFAPGFLDFMNEGLEKFKDDPTVYSICGYRFFYNLKFKDNNFFRQHTDFNAWGCGEWKHKYEKLASLDVKYLRRMVYNPFRVLKIWRVSNNRVVNLSGFSTRRLFKRGDNVLTLYMIDNGMTQIMPAKSLVRNIGWDESGLHCLGFSDDVVKKHMYQEIDESPTFNGLTGTGWEYFDENNEIIRKEDFQQFSFMYSLYSYIKRLICFWR